MKKTNWNISEEAEARAVKFGIDKFALDAMISQTGLGDNIILKVLEKATQSGYVAPVVKADIEKREVSVVQVSAMANKEGREKIRGLFQDYFHQSGRILVDGRYEFEDHFAAGMFYRNAVKVESDTITFRVNK